MKFRIPALAAVVCVLALSSLEANAQPAAPIRSPGFSTFGGVMGRGPAGIGGYYGMIRPNMQMQQLQAEMVQAYQSMANMQAAVTNMVASGLPQTGRGAVYNNLGHWYPASRYGSGGTGGAMGTRYGMVGQVAPVLPMGNTGFAGVAVSGGGIRR